MSITKQTKFNDRAQRTPSNRIPNLKSRQYLLNYFRQTRKEVPSAPLRAARALTRWAMMRVYSKESRISRNSRCFISGRARGTSQRYGIARTKIKYFSDQGKLLGLRKSSW